MTRFEELAKEMNVMITVDKNGLYTGVSKALAVITNEVVLSENDAVFNLEWDRQKEIIKDRFYRVFPYKAR